jgi:transposase
VLWLAATRGGARCPLCGRRSRRLHSRYFRTLADSPVAGRAVQLRVQVRRFRCANPACRRRIFAERLPQLAADYARRTHDQRAALTELGFALGGSAGARLGGRLRFVGSRATILRLVHAAPTPTFPTPRALGVDDWALKRGQTYGTILVDLERRRPVDLLEDRSASGFAAWLAAHPGVEIIARDRGGAYADGARRGAPAAIQVADRFHLLMNIGDALERVLARKHSALSGAAREIDRALAAADTPSLDPAHPGMPPAREVDGTLAAADTAPGPAADTGLPLPPLGWSKRESRDRQARRARRLARYETVVELRARGATLSEIAGQVGVSRATVRRFLRAGTFPERASPRRRPSQIVAYEPYLRRRWGEGCQNASQLWREIRAQGFPGAASLVGRYLANWRATPGRPGPPRKREPAPGRPSAPPPAPTRVLSSRRARWLLSRPDERLSEADRGYRTELLRRDAEIEAGYRLAEDFGRMVRERDRTALAPWLGRALESTRIGEVLTWRLPSTYWPRRRLPCVSYSSPGALWSGSHCRRSFPSGSQSLVKWRTPKPCTPRSRPRDPMSPSSTWQSGRPRSRSSSSSCVPGASA